MKKQDDGEAVDFEFLETLIERLGNNDERVQMSARNEILALDREMTVPKLIDCMDCGNKIKETNAIILLGAIKDERTIGPLIKKLETSKDFEIRREICQALGAIDCIVAVGALQNTIERDENQKVRDAAQKAIRDIMSSTKRTGAERRSLEPIFLDALTANFRREMQDAMRKIGRAGKKHAVKPARREKGLKKTWLMRNGGMVH
jgi:HEAT repeat protein